jgi:GntR family transcriptional regulator, transcriptional repressor for pyruvate dehydrogenase complex
MHPGDRLPTEAEWIRQLGVSRGALREGVRQLESQGLIRVVHGVGMFLSNPDAIATCMRAMRDVMTVSGRDLAEVAAFRRVVECFAVRQAAVNPSPGQIAELERLCGLLRSDIPIDDMVRADWEFHLKLAEMGANRLVRGTILVFRDLLYRNICETSFDAAKRDEAKQLHLAIVRGVAARDPDAAEAAMRAHMDVLDDQIKSMSDHENRTGPP